MHDFQQKTDLLKRFEKISLRSYVDIRSGKRGTDAKKTSGEDAMSTKTKEVRCYNCLENGHLASKCTKPKRKNGACFRCGSEDHKLKDCPKQSSKDRSTTDRPTTENTTSVVQTKSVPSESYMVNLTYGRDEYSNESIFIVKALVDSGSPISLIREEYVPPSARESSVSSEKKFHGLNGSELQVVGMFRENVKVNDVPLELEFRVVPTKTMNVPALLGRDFMAIPGICLTLDKGVTISRKENVSVTANEINVSEILTINYVESMSEPQFLNINPKIESQISE